MRNLPPFPDICKGCARREVGCHSWCREFADTKAEYNTQKMRLVDAHKGESDLIGLRVESMERIKRKQRDRRTRK